MLLTATRVTRTTTGMRGFATSALSCAPAPAALLALKELIDEKHHALARDWLSSFVVDDVPKDAYEVSYARSSGPGGQHVNKTNSKAVVRCDIHRAKGDWLPPFVVPELQKSPYYHAPSLLLTCQTSRSAPQNLATCVDNLHATILAAGRNLVPGETSQAQKERVRGLEKAETRRRRQMKEKHKSKKEARSSKHWD